MGVRVNTMLEAVRMHKLLVGLVVVVVLQPCRGMLSQAPLKTASIDLEGESPGTGRTARALAMWELGGNAKPAEGPGPDPSAVVRLTADEQGQRGWMFTRQPLNTLGQEWQIDVEFRIHGKGMTYFGDGFAMWYTPKRFQSGTAFGHSNKFTGLGVFFDTYDNDAGSHMHKHPWVSAVVSTPENPGFFDHNDAGKDAQRHGCHSRVREFGQDRKIGVLRVRYHRRTLVIKLIFQQKPGTYSSKYAYQWTECVRLKDVDIPPGYYLGFTASTGDLSDNHDIFSVNVRGEAGASKADVPEEVQAMADPPAPMGDTAAAAAAARELQSTGEQTKRANGDGDALAASRRAQSQRSHRAAGITKPPPTTPTATPPPPAAAATATKPAKPDDRPIAAPSQKELQDINAVLKATPLIKHLEQLANRGSVKLDGMHETLEDEIAATKAAMQDMIDALKRTEKAIEARVQVLQDRVDKKMQQVVIEHKARSTNWVLPFIGLAVLIIGCAVVAYRKHNKFVKDHML